MIISIKFLGNPLAVDRTIGTASIVNQQNFQGHRQRIRDGKQQVGSQPRWTDTLKTRLGRRSLSAELLRQSIFPRNILADTSQGKTAPPKNVGIPPSLSTGTYRGTKLALAQKSKRIEKRSDN